MTHLHLDVKYSGVATVCLPAAASEEANTQRMIAMREQVTAPDSIPACANSSSSEATNFKSYSPKKGQAKANTHQPHAIWR